MVYFAFSLANLLQSTSNMIFFSFLFFFKKNPGMIVILFLISNNQSNKEVVGGHVGLEPFSYFFILFFCYFLLFFNFLTCGRSAMGVMAVLQQISATHFNS